MLSGWRSSSRIGPRPNSSFDIVQEEAAVKLLFVSHSADLVGAELFLCELVEGLTELPQVTCEVVLPKGGPLRKRLQQLGVHVWTVPFSRWATEVAPLRGKMLALARNIVSLTSLVRLMRSTRPSIVITNTITIPSAAFAAALTRRPHVWVIHEFGVPEHGIHFHFGRGLTLRLAHLLSRFIVVPSETLRRELSSFIPGERLRIVYPAARVSFNTRPADRETDDTFRLAMVGQITPGKRQDEAIGALAILRDRGLQARLTLIGWQDRAYVERLRGLGGTLGVADFVDLVEPTQDPFPYFTSAHVALVCARNQPGSRVMLEAMKCGCPVVAARSGGLPEFIRDNWNGLLYEPGNVEDLAAKIEAVCMDSERAARLSTDAQVWATERFTVEATRRDFLALMNDVLPGRPFDPDLESALPERPLVVHREGSTS